MFSSTKRTRAKTSVTAPHNRRFRASFSKYERKWQRIWEKRRIFESQVKENRPKYFIIFAYPGISGYLHVGHLRSYTYPDIMARYKRMCGFNVLFPAGFHASGLPAITLARRIERKDPSIIGLLRMNKCSERTIKELHDPEHVVRFFAEEYVKTWKRMGYSIDWTRLISTIDPAYKRFIEWQFQKLNDLGLLVQKPYFAPYCPNCGPIAVDPSETDLSEGGEATVLEFTVIKFRCGEYVLPAATLRPETIFGVTNIWLNPGQESIIVSVGSEKWIVSHDAYEKMKFQFEGVEETGVIDNASLLGKRCISPITNREIPILPASFVSSSVGTGVVMSVPSHAPYDWVALDELKKASNRISIDLSSVDPISIILTEGFGDNPSKDLVVEFKVTGQDETEKLDKITEILYRKEYHGGVMKGNCNEYSGLKVSEAKNRVIEYLSKEKLGTCFYDFSEEVVCRCGSKAVIRRIPDQWFIRYSDVRLKNSAHDCVDKMTVKPDAYRRNVQSIIDWYDDRPCVRQGRWLGTRFPYDRSWIIEPISDSTLYPAIYIISKYINDGAMGAEQLCPELFDYVILSHGRIDDVARTSGITASVIETMKKDFNYWYPLDMNCGGKEHQTVHFPVFILNHVAILLKSFWPRGVFVNWWVVGNAGKISKSKGGVEPIPQVVKEYTADGIRLYYAHVSSPHADVVWDPENAEIYRSRLQHIWALILSMLKLKGTKKRTIDRWLRSRVNTIIQKVSTCLEGLDLREAAQEVFYTLPSDLDWYLGRGGENSKVVRYVLQKWVLMTAPFTPHLSEELWQRLGRKPCVSVSKWPIPDRKEINQTAECSETYVKNLVEDVKSVKAATGISNPRVLYVYTAADWKWRLLEIVRRNRGKVADSMEEAMKDVTLRARKQEVADLIKTFVDKHLFESVRISEEKILEDANIFLERELGIKILINRQYDPNMRAAKALPLRPAIYVEE